MNFKFFSFTKFEKKVENIENKINQFLDKNTFKYACQSESTVKGKFYLSVFYKLGGYSKIRAKVFKNNNERLLEKDVQSFLTENDVSIKCVTQSSTTSSVYIVMFYESRKVDATEEENKDK